MLASNLRTSGPALNRAAFLIERACVPRYYPRPAAPRPPSYLPCWTRPERKTVRRNTAAHFSPFPALGLRYSRCQYRTLTSNIGNLDSGRHTALYIDSLYSL